jgi:hypothetical protein
MILHRFKRYIILLSYACIFNTVFCCFTRCMNTALSHDKNVRKYASNFADTLGKTALFCLTTAFQFSNVNGYEPGTKAACYDACAQNCSVEIGPMCGFDLNKIVLPVLLASGLSYTLCTYVGYNLAKGRKSEKKYACISQTEEGSSSS